MLLHDAALSYLHFVFAFILAGALAAEAFVLRLPVDGRVARLLLRIDLFYAISAVGVIVAVSVAVGVIVAVGAAQATDGPLYCTRSAPFAFSSEGGDSKRPQYVVDRVFGEAPTARIATRKPTRTPRKTTTPRKTKTSRRS